MLTNSDRRKYRTRNKILKNNKSLRPRIVVSRSNKNIYVQLIDAEGKVLQSCSTLSFPPKERSSGVENATKVGEKFTELCVKAGLKEVVFDKGSYAYNGRVKALADSCRKAGLKF